MFNFGTNTHPMQVTHWQREIQIQTKSQFNGKLGPHPVPAESVFDRLYREIGRLKMMLE